MNIINLQDKNLYYIGGVVRDEILNLPSFDTDLTYVGNAIKFAQNIDNVKILKINEPFGTVRIKINDKEIDIASTRNETYPKCGHLPVVTDLGCSLKDDVFRRDFTINALAKSTQTGEIIDYTGGLKDIQSKILRVLHSKSFIDDPTRILRALKFSVRFGFDLEQETKKLQEKYLENINYDMSYKRLKKELEETFNLNSWTAFEKFINENIYKLIAPTEFNLPKINLEPIIKKYNPKIIWIIYVGLLPNISALPLTKREKKIISDFQEIKNKTFKTDLEIYKTFEKLELETIIMYSTIDFSAVEKFLNKLRNIKITVTGSDIEALGIKPSKDYQKCFDYILERKLKNPALSQVQEIQLIKDFFNFI
jgi:poly(A) polymerase/tRNA nucleotidyltransferase (CCA-adding enzyme)